MLNYKCAKVTTLSLKKLDYYMCIYKESTLQLLF